MFLIDNRNYYAHFSPALILQRKQK